MGNEKVKLEIDGREITASKGMTVLQAAREAGINIPNLCASELLEPYGGCRLCIVEIEGMRGLPPSCTTAVREGMKVRTNTEDLFVLRKLILELLLANHYADCVCPGQVECPAHVDVQGYLSLARLGYYAEALNLIKERNPLPVVCGRICVRKCELGCRRNDVDEPVGINYVKRFVSERPDHDAVRPEKAPATSKKVAVVGGGPAGLSCAYYLALKGHGVKIFDAMPQLGGMLLWGIPEYRLPKAELEREIKEILDLGVDVELNKALGKDFTLKGLKDQDGFDAVFLGMGAPLGKSMGVPGEDAEGIESALDFLRDTQMKGPRKLHGKVVVVGGGNSAIDAARTALRSGAEDVTILYRRTRKEMPANPEEVDAAEKEGVKLDLLAAPVEVLVRDGRLTGLRCIKMELGEPDASGRRRPVPIQGSEYEYPCDFVFSAIGQDTDPEPIKAEPENIRPEISRRGTVVVNKDTMETNIPGVFAGGDLITGPAVVIDAIAHGRSAAEAIDSYLRTGKVEKPRKIFTSRRDLFGPIPERVYEDVARTKRHHQPELEMQKRRTTFEEVELGLPEDDMTDEACRCMECGCKAQFNCELRKLATEHGIEELRFFGDVKIHKLDLNHPIIIRDDNKCILCGKCVRACKEINGVTAIEIAKRGYDSVIQTFGNVPLNESICESCGECVEACPTGALAVRIWQWPDTEVPTICPYCGVGCGIMLGIKCDRVVSVRGDAENPTNKGNLCVKGRFGSYEFVNHPDRLKKPLIKKGNEFVEADWEEALDLVAERLKQYTGTGRFAALASAKVSNEENYLMQKFTRAVMKTNNIDHCARL